MKTGDMLGPYHVLGKLGEGGMGEVYRATDMKLKRDVALKVLPAGVASDPDRMARFQREAEVLASLNHSNIAHLHGLEESGGISALVMELVEGEDLRLRVARGPIPLDAALRIAQQIAAALEAAHEQGIVHRDLKPGNIKIRPDGTVKVLDFGLAKSMASARSAAQTVSAISSVGLVIGTPAYMSPEQARGEPTGRETDIWAFGLVLYEMLSGVSPFARPTSADTLVQVLTASVDESLLPAAVPGPVRRLIRRCLEKDPKRRWRHVGDARIEIEEALAHSADPATATSVGPAAPMTRRKALTLGAAAAGVLATGLGAGAWLDRRYRPSLVPSFQRLTFRRGLIRSARIAPDGETILYGALWDDEPCRVHTVRIDGPESRALDLPQANILAISRSGEMALALGAHEGSIITYGTLAKVPMAGGAPRPLVEAVKFADWSPDGKDLAIVRRVDAGDQLEFPIGRVLSAPQTGKNTGLGFARVSPDGTHVAFVRYRSPGSLLGRVEIVDQSGVFTSLSDESLNIHGLVWRGREIVYTAADERPLFRALYSVRPGGASHTITRLPGNTTVWDAMPDGRLITAHTDDRTITMAQISGDDRERDLTWLDASTAEDLSADGRWLLFTENGQGGGPESAVYLRGTDGSPALRLGAGRGLALSPDGKWAICASGSYPSPYIELIPTGAGEARRLPGHDLSYSAARWLPDGRRAIIAAFEPGKQHRLFLHDLGSARPTAITPEGIRAWAVSPEGSTVAVQGPGLAIHLYGLDGGTVRDVPGLTGAEVLVEWIASGLLVTRPDDSASSPGAIYRLDPLTGRQAPWKNIHPRDRAGFMRTQGFHATPDGSSVAYTWHRALSSLYLADGLGGN